MKSKELLPNLAKGSMVILIVISLIKLLLHLYTNAFASYGIFRDELYYIACSDRLAFGYVDQPPLSIFILFLSRLVLGESLFAIRLLPAIAATMTVFITGLMVRKLGGGKIAVIIAASAVALAPIQLGMNTVFSMNAFDIFFWALASYIVVLILKEGNQKLWILLGIILGLGLLNKISMIWFFVGFFVALLLTSHRRQLTRKWPWITGVLAFVLFSPFIIWNLSHDFAHIEFIRNASMYKYSGLTPLDFIIGQLLLQNPAALPIWIAGLWFFLFAKQGRHFRLLGIIYVVAFLILIINRTSKAEYLSPAYPMLFAAGAVFVERLCRRKHWGWLKFAGPAFLIVSGLLLSPIALPVLPVETYINYSNFLGINPHTSEGKELVELPQFYADMFGWENMAATVAEVYHLLPEDEQSKTVIFARNYGESGAIEYYSEKYGLPQVISSHNNYWIWGYGDENAETIIIIGGEKEDYLDSFGQIEQAAVIRCQYCMPYENNLPVYIARNIKVDIKEHWNAIKHFE